MAQAGHMVGVEVLDADVLGVTVGVGVPHASQIGDADVLGVAVGVEVDDGVTLSLGDGYGFGLHVGVPATSP